MHACAAPVRRLNVLIIARLGPERCERMMRNERVVGAEGFEPTTPASQTLCATRLRYAPTRRRSYVMDGGLSRHPRPFVNSG